MEGCPGAELGEYNFYKATKEFRSKYGSSKISKKDILSHALYPQVFINWKDYEVVYGDETHQILNP